MSRAKKLLMMIVALAICAAAYFSISYVAKNKNTSEYDLQLSDMSVSDLRAIEWEFNSETVKLVSEDGKNWQYDSDNAFPLSSEKAADLASKAASVKAVKVVSDTMEEPSKYGLNTPKIKITVTIDGGEQTVYSIGNYNDASGYYYLSYSGSAALYYVDSSLYTAFSVNLSDLIEYEFIEEINTTDVKHIKIKNGEKTLSVTYHPNSKNAYSIDGSDAVCDDSAITNMINSFINITWLSCEKYNVTETELKTFGLDSPTAEFTIDYQYEKEAESASGDPTEVSGSDTLLIGKQNGNNKYYAMIKGGHHVYTVSEETAELYMISSEESLYSKKLMSFSAEQLTMLTIRYRGNDYTINAESTGHIDDDGEDIEMKYTVDNKEIALSSFISLLTNLNADSVQKNTISDTGELLLSVNVKLTDDSEQTLAIYEYDDSLSVVSFGGETKYFAAESACDDICDAFRDAVSNMN